MPKLLSHVKRNLLSPSPYVRWRLDRGVYSIVESKTKLGWPLSAVACSPHMGGEAMALEKELETYRTKLAELMPDEGKFVLISDSEVVGTYTSYEDAVKE